MLKFKFKKVFLFILTSAIMIICLSFITFAQEDVATTQSSIELVSFESDKYFIGLDESVVLSWEVTNAEKVEIGTSIVPAKGILEVWPTETTQYVLKAYGANGEIKIRNLLINVISLEIKEFSTSTNNIVPGEPVLLTWNVPGASVVNIKELTDKDLPPDGTLEIFPIVTTKYTLEAFGFDGSFAKKELTVTVKEAEITIFECDKTEIEPGETAVIKWNANYFKSIRIIGIDKDSLPKSGFEEVSPLETTTYKLEATTFNGIVISREITLKVKGMHILDFNADKVIINRGEMIKLSWSVKNAESCKIVTNYGNKLSNRPLKGTVAVTPNKNITYQLVVTDKFGNEIYESIDITVK